MKKPKILLIDDDELFLSLTKKTLKATSNLKRVKCINHVKEAREYLDSCLENKAKFPDIIFLDIYMPDIGGLEFAELYGRKYADIFPDTKLVVLSSSISRNDKEMALDIPVVEAYLPKPLTEEKVQELFNS